MGVFINNGDSKLPEERLVCLQSSYQNHKIDTTSALTIVL